MPYNAADLADALRRFKAGIFQALAHPTRIAIIELLENGELSAGELIEKLVMEQANVSQHLAVLRAKQIVVNRKAGNQVFYSVRDPMIIRVLVLMRRYFQSHLKESLELLDHLEDVVANGARNGKKLLLIGALLLPLGHLWSAPQPMAARSAAGVQLEHR